MSEAKKTKSTTGYYLISAILFIALGVVTIIFNSQITAMIDNIMKWVVAFVFGIIAIIDIIKFASNRSKETIKDLIIGILALVAAVVMIIMPNMLIMLVGILLGLYLVIEGFFKVKACFGAKKSEVKVWYLPLIFGILSILLGAFLICSPWILGELVKWFVIIVGVVLIYAGVQNVISLFVKGK
ncbi:MAG: DUF308 domain-containing protein [Lachnospiraceae bacterium]|nr:DUF308 domain-containing protein [Lachnospiraceae bacterium]